MYNSTLEIANVFVLLTIIIGQEDFFAPWAKKAQRILSCGGVVGADEPLQVGKWGSGQHPKALREIVIFYQFSCGLGA